MERLKLVLDTLDDGALTHKLYHIRGKGRNDWPCEAMWNSFIASFFFDYDSIASLLWELSRNKQLRDICGFKLKAVKQADGMVKIYVAPSESAYSNFLANLMDCQDEMDRMFNDLAEYMYEHLEHFGEILMIDGKAIQSYGTKISDNPSGGRRGEWDAGLGVKTYTSAGHNGETVKKAKKWFGFKLHLIADATYELPIAYSLTKAGGSEYCEAYSLLEGINQNHPNWLKHCDYFLGDKGYDSGKLHEQLEMYGIHPIIDIRNGWQDKDETRQYRDTRLVYNYKGDVWYIPEGGNAQKLSFKGYDKDTDSLRYGFHPSENDNRIFRIKREENPRIFTVVARDSHKWKRLYKKRTSMERIYGRVDRDYNYEKHTIRGKDKMRMFLNVTFLVYMTMAKAKIDSGGKENHCKKYA